MEALTAAQTLTLLGLSPFANRSMFVGTDQFVLSGSTEQTIYDTTTAQDYEGSLTLASPEKGDTLRFFMAGNHQGHASAAETLTFRVKLAGILIVSVAVPSGDADGATSKPLILRGSITLNDAAASSTVRGFAELIYETEAGDVATVAAIGSGSAINLTIDQDFDITGQYSVGAAAYALTVENTLAERLRANA